MDRIIYSIQCDEGLKATMRVIVKIEMQKWMAHQPSTLGALASHHAFIQSIHSIPFRSPWNA
jgi:hypothetical protein